VRRLQRNLRPGGSRLTNGHDVWHPTGSASDIAFANRNETKHLPYGEGTLGAEPLREALDEMTRPATVISESPDESSSQAIRAALVGPG